MNKEQKNLLIDLKDVVVISLPHKCGDSIFDEWDLTRWEKVYKFGIPKGTIFELGILNKEKTKVIPVKHFGKMNKVLNVEDVVYKSITGEYYFNNLKFYDLSDDCPYLFFNKELTKEACVGQHEKLYVKQKEIENGIKLKKLAFENNYLIAEQIKDYFTSRMRRLYEADKAPKVKEKNHKEF